MHRETVKYKKVKLLSLDLLIIPTLTTYNAKQRVYYETYSNPFILSVVRKQASSPQLTTW